MSCERLSRYMELNVRSSSLYRKYNDDVPQYLRNRPRRLIDDMRKKMIALETGVVAGVQMKSDRGVFLVPARGSRPSHEVVFGDESTFCSCTCQSFQRTQLLCVHFCAVFHAFPDWSFDRVCPLYTQSPLLTLDEDILQAGASSLARTGGEAAPEPMPEEASSNLPKLLKSERQKARVLLRKMFEMTYSVSDVDALQNLVRRLEPVYKEVSESLPRPSPVQPGCVDPTLSRTGAGSRKRKLQLTRQTLPLKKGSATGSSQIGLNVVEVHVIDGSAMGDVAASGPSFTL